MEHTFCLTYALPSETLSEDVLMEKLASAGCTDALVGLGLRGHLSLAFTREAESVGAAMLSAKRALEQALPEARLVDESGGSPLAIRA